MDWPVSFSSKTIAFRFMYYVIEKEACTDLGIVAFQCLCQLKCSACLYQSYPLEFSALCQSYTLAYLAVCNLMFFAPPLSPLNASIGA